MVDVFNDEKRSEIMRAVKSSGNRSTEMKLISVFKKYEIKGWRRTYKLIGNPDFVFPKKRIVIFADGCFWHGHNCRNTKPKDNKEYWNKKIQRNKERDEFITEILERKGWVVVRIWECEIKKEVLPDKLMFLVD